MDLIFKTNLTRDGEAGDPIRWTQLGPLNGSGPVDLAGIRPALNGHATVCNCFGLSDSDTFNSFVAVTCILQ